MDYADTMEKLRRASNGLSSLATLTNNYFVDGKQIKDILGNILEDLDDTFDELQRSLDSDK